MARSSLAEALLKLEPAERRAELKQMSHRQRRSLKRHWRLWAHEGQAPPQGGWHTWLVMAGRGYGKTRAGAEWVREVAENDPTARIALIGASLGEARRVMVEGPSGLLAIAPPRQRPSYEPSKRQLTWPKGAVATLYSAGEPESLRGPQHSHACRAGPEGVFRQRGACADRCAAPPGDRRRSRRPSATPAEGETWLIGDAPTGAWADHAGEIASYQAGGWAFAAPRDGVRVLDRSTGQDIRWIGGWLRPAAPPEPTGGTTVDTEARTAIADLIAALVEGGFLAGA